MTVTYVCRGFRCDTEGIRTKSEDEFNEHYDEHHPVYCNTCSRDHLASYAYNPGAPGAYTYCAECAERGWERNETFRRKVYRITRTANEAAERLANDHPVEQKLTEVSDGDVTVYACDHCLRPIPPEDADPNAYEHYHEDCPPVRWDSDRNRTEAIEGGDSG